ncbi:hypothetical protein KC329_g84 [Hortaea werneckii]|nr:hypothetical protein KC329_g84 [Hortaea werneckii]
MCKVLLGLNIETPLAPPLAPKLRVRRRHTSSPTETDRPLRRRLTVGTCTQGLDRQWGNKRGRSPLWVVSLAAFTRSDCMWLRTRSFEQAVNSIPPFGTKQGATVNLSFHLTWARRQ